VVGLRANGVTVTEGRLDTILNWYGALIQQGVADRVLAHDALLLDGRLNRSALASAHITRGALLAWPDWVVVVSGHNYNAHDARALRRAGLKVALLCTESPYWMDVEPHMASFYDVAFTNERTALDHFRRAQPQTHYLPHAYNPAVHSDALPPLDEPSDVFFCGSMFDERKALFAAVDWGGVAFTARGFLDLDQGVTDLMDNFTVARAYRAAKIALNHHRTTTMHGTGGHIVGAESLGPRAYEIAACGGFQLMDDSRAERLDIFGECMPTYRAGDAADLTQQIRFWLDRPAERGACAAAQHAAILPHSWTNRAKQVLEVLAC
jgi:spore maturation protein CgeB